MMLQIIGGRITKTTFNSLMLLLLTHVFQTTTTFAPPDEERSTIHFCLLVDVVPLLPLPCPPPPLPLPDAGLMLLDGAMLWVVGSGKGRTTYDLISGVKCSDFNKNIFAPKYERVPKTKTEGNGGSSPPAPTPKARRFHCLGRDADDRAPRAVSTAGGNNNNDLLRRRHFPVDNDGGNPTYMEFFVD